MSEQSVIPLVLYCLTMTVTPGPNNIILAATGANFGYRRSLPHIVGATLSIPVMATLVGAGLGQLLMVYPAAYTGLTVLGSAYPLWLAWKVAHFSGEVNTDDGARPLTIRQAAVFQWLNPKCWMMYVGAVSLYTASGGRDIWEVVLVAVIFTAMVPPSFSFWALLGVSVGRWLKTDARRRAFNLTLAATLVGSLVLALI